MENVEFIGVFVILVDCYLEFVMFVSCKIIDCFGKGNIVVVVLNFCG